MRLIDAEKLHVVELYRSDSESETSGSFLEKCDAVLLSEIRDQPAIGCDFVRIHAHWIHTDRFYPAYSINQGFACSQCKTISRHISKYCPNCGAVMDEPEEWEQAEDK